MWDAFLGGEWAGGGEAEEGKYMQQTEQFYQNIIGPAFDLDDTFGTTDLAGAYAQFSNVEFERAEREFRASIGDPYGGGPDDPFSWEKVSRYNTEAGGYDRIQDLLEDELYGQGKFLGGETGADYGTATAKGLETYSSGLRGERESLTYEGLTGGAGIASGTGGSVLRSGASESVAEDVLIEAYKKAKTLGSEYRAGSKTIEEDLEGDLNVALTTYLEAIDDEKSDWFNSVMRNVNLFKDLEMDLPAGTTLETWSDEQMEEELSTGLYGSYYREWACGYGQKMDPDNPGECIDTEEYTTERYGREDDPDTDIDESATGYKFRDDPACGIGELWKETDADTGDGECVMMEDVALIPDDYGYLCQPGEIDECGDCNGGNEACADECGVPNGENDCLDCAGVPNGVNVLDECGVCGGNNEECDDGCGVPNGPGKEECSDGSMACPGDCSQPSEQCPQGQALDDHGNCQTVMGCTDPEATNYDPNAVDDYGCEYDPVLEEDCEGVPGGSAVVDECGVCEGPGKVQCQDGETMVCDYDECPDIELEEHYCAPHETWNESTQACDPTGEPTCPEGYEWNKYIGCWPIDDGGDEEFNVLCHEGEDYESWTTGSSPTDYSNCPVYPDLTCDDGSDPDHMGLCPEDYEATESGCECKCSSKRNNKTGKMQYTCRRDCPGMPEDGDICGANNVDPDPGGGGFGTN